MGDPSFDKRNWNSKRKVWASWAKWCPSIPKNLDSRVQGLALSLTRSLIWGKIFIPLAVGPLWLGMITVATSGA